MYRSLHATLLTFFCLVSLLFVTESAQGSLHGYVKKYKDTKVSQHSLKKLAKYNYLIEYFASFSYFRPKHKVSADFIRALILAESNGDPNALSHKNAMGLGQIILTTGREAARELSKSTTRFRYIDHNRLKNLQTRDLYDPAMNILLTCYLISKYNYKFDGKLELVLSAWNAGENVKTLAYGQPPPYKETLNLIGKVNGYYLYLLRQKRYLR